MLIVTWVLTELMSNNAAAALAFPVALGVAHKLGLDPKPFVMAVLYGASCSFITPYGYQTNLMVMAPGRYTLGDFARAGTPVAMVYLIGGAGDDTGLLSTAMIGGTTQPVKRQECTPTCQVGTRDHSWSPAQVTRPGA